MPEMAVVSFTSFFATIVPVDVVAPLAVQFLPDGIARCGVLAA